MKKIGLLSDTHSFWDDKYEKYFGECDEIWHVGDIGSMEVADRLAAIAPLRAVYGNIDTYDMRRRFGEILRFKCEDVDVLMKHIGGYPGRYDPSVRGILMACPPKLFISGHSHLLRVLYDKTIGCLHVNPGAAGQSGFHKVRTLVRFAIDGSEIKDMEVIELGDRGNPLMTAFH
jgi:putative phosphoesterase